MNKRVRGWLIGVLLCAVLPACGGGTDGTGGRMIDGRVLNRDGVGQAGIEVILDQTGDSARTDEQGNFLLHDEPMSGPIGLRFESWGHEYSLSFEVPAEARLVHMDCTYDVPHERYEITTMWWQR